MQQFIRIVFKPSESPDDSGGFVSLENASIVRLYGSSIQVFWDIQESLNLSFDMHFHGWSTAISLVSNGTLDWGASSMSLSEGLAKQASNAGLGVNFLHPINAVESNVYFRPPLSEDVHVTLFRPFILQVWISILVCMIFCTVLVYKVQLSSSLIGIGHNCNHQKILSASPSHVFLQLIQFLRGRYFKNELLESDGILPSTANVHWHQGFAVLIGTFLSSFIVMIYTAKIAAIFARKDNNVKSPEDLVKLGYSVTSFSHLHFERIFKEPRKVRELLEKKFLGAKDALEKVVAPGKADPRFAFLTHPDGFHVYGRCMPSNFTHELCSVLSFASTTKTPQSMYLTKGSPFREQINLKIVQLLERGLNYRYQHNYRRQYEYNCGEANFLGFTQLSNSHLSWAFIILMVGAASSAFIEMIFFIKREIDSKRHVYRYKISTIRDSGTNIRLHPL